MKGQTASAQRLLEKAYDDTAPPTPKIREMALAIATGYAEALYAYGAKAAPLWIKGWQALHRDVGVPKHMCAARLRSLIESSLVQLHAKNESVPLKFTSGQYKIVARKEGYAAPRPSISKPIVKPGVAGDDKPLVQLAAPTKPHVDTAAPSPPPPPAARSGAPAPARPGPARTPALGMKAAAPAGTSGRAEGGGGGEGDIIAAPAPLRNNASLVAVLQYVRRTYRMVERALEGVEPLPVYMDDKQIADLENSLMFTAQACADALNRKTLIPPPTHAIFHELYRSQASLLNVGAAILRWRADRMADVSKFITARQAAKFLKGQEPSQIPLYEPKSREEAVFMRWYGLPCPACESWRVRETQNIYLSPEEARRIGDDTRPLLQCYDCNHMWRGYTVMSCAGPKSCGMLFYREDLAKIKRTGACPSCKKEIRLPDHITQYLAHPETWWQKKRRHPRPKAPAKEVLP